MWKNNFNLNGYFNYRIIEKQYEQYKYYEIHEVYYEDDGRIFAWAENATKLYFENNKDLKNEIKHIKQAKRKTILKEENDTLVDTHKYLRDIKE